MPTRPPIKATTGQYTSAGIINAILDDPANYELTGIPHANATTESIRMVGEQITAFVPRKNQFLNALINMVGMERLNYMLFNNPWSVFKQGKLEMGETVEQIWTGLAEVFPYNPEKSETRVLKRRKPDVKSAFHSINYREVYSVTVSEMDLKRAFLSVQGMKDLVETIIGSLSRSESVDEFMMMKYLFATLLLDGKIPVQKIEPITNATANDVVTDVAALTNFFQFPSTKYNMAGVVNTTTMDRLYILESATANAQIKVNSLATAFNVDYVKFMGKVLMFDSLGTYDWERMAKICGEDPGFRKFTDEEVALLDTIDIIACDEQFLQIYDAVAQMETPFINGEGAFTNYFYHVWQIYSASPFHNCLAFTTADSSVTGVTVRPSTAVVAKGESIGLQAIVTTTGFADSDVIWEISTQGVAELTHIGQDGVLYISGSETVDQITVRATSMYDETKYGESTITVTD